MIRSCGVPQLPFLTRCGSVLRLAVEPVARAYRGPVGAGYVGLFEMGVAFVLWQQALRCAENTAQVGNLIFVSRSSLCVIYLLVDEAIRPSTPVGLALVVAGLVLQQMRSSARLFNR